jgi:hypothetical protein
MLKKKILASFQRIIELFILPKNLSLCSKKYGVGIRDPKSGSKKPIPDPGSGSRVKKAPDPGSGSATLLASTRLFKGKNLPRLFW